jgi:hypothetical protein
VYAVHANGLSEITLWTIAEKVVRSAIGAASSLTAVLVLVVWTKFAKGLHFCLFSGRQGYIGRIRS